MILQIVLDIILCLGEAGGDTNQTQFLPPNCSVIFGDEDFCTSTFPAAGPGGAQPPGGDLPRPPAGGGQSPRLSGTEGEDQEGQDGRHAGRARCLSRRLETNWFDLNL